MLIPFHSTSADQYALNYRSNQYIYNLWLFKQLLYISRTILCAAATYEIYGLCVIDNLSLNKKGISVLVLSALNAGLIQWDMYFNECILQQNLYVLYICIMYCGVYIM